VKKALVLAVAKEREAAEIERLAPKAMARAAHTAGFASK
jgi:hypothetical protein